MLLYSAELIKTVFEKGSLSTLSVASDHEAIETIELLSSYNAEQRSGECTIIISRRAHWPEFSNRVEHNVNSVLFVEHDAEPEKIAGCLGDNILIIVDEPSGVNTDLIKVTHCYLGVDGGRVVFITRKDKSYSKFLVDHKTKVREAFQVPNRMLGKRR